MTASKLPRSVQGKTVTVVGFGRSGAAAARLALKKGAESVIVQDKRDAKEIGEDKADQLMRDGANLELGGHQVDTLKGSDLIVVSPGVPHLPELRAAEEKGVPIISEVELALWYNQAPVVAVTGTNGKSTVTALTGEMVKASGRPTFMGGNLGVPLCEVIDTPATGPDGAVVLELSSYQLERTHSLRARVAILLNLTPDHLDRYGTMAAYGAAKQRIFQNQTRDDSAVVPAADALMVAMARAGAAKTLTFGGTDGTATARVQGDAFFLAGEKYPLSLLKIRGAHNVENAMACAVAAHAFGVKPAAIKSALSSFTGLPHRMQFVLEDDGIAYYDDSKATNVGAAEKALQGVERKVVLIGGGRHKGGSYAPLRPLLKEKGRALVLIGEAAPIMRKELGDIVPCHRADDMFDAVRIARNVARPGDAVLLAPACSSLDMFENYEERGRVFSAAARALAGTPRQEEDLDDGVDVEIDLE